MAATSMQPHTHASASSALHATGSAQTSANRTTQAASGAMRRHRRLVTRLACCCIVSATLYLLVSQTVWAFIEELAHLATETPFAR